MSTQLIRDSGPDKRLEMTESNVSRVRDPESATPDRKRGRRLTWIPAVAALLTLLIGLSDVLAVFKPAWHQALEAHKVNTVVPGTLTNVTRTSDVIIGLLLLMLARGLRRRKRRAWQAVIALLVFDIVIHFLHFPRTIPVSGFVAIVLLGRSALPARGLLRGRRPAQPAGRAAGLPRPRRDGLRDRPRLPRGRAAFRRLLARPADAGRDVRAGRRVRAGQVGVRRARRPVSLPYQRARRVHGRRHHLPVPAL